LPVKFAEVNVRVAAQHFRNLWLGLRRFYP
jgi:hypothetical protein